MFFELDLQSGKAVYQQLVDQVKMAVANGRLRAGEKLPSIRDVAVALHLNRNTVARVYTELEREGVIYNRPGLGCFAGGRGSTLSPDVQREDLVNRFDEALAQAKLYGYSQGDVKALMAERVESVYGAKIIVEEAS